MEDLLPPVFSVTPKGSGAGYGVGFDLEEFLSQSLDMVGDTKDRCGGVRVGRGPRGPGVPSLHRIPLLGGTQTSCG